MAKTGMRYPSLRKHASQIPIIYSVDTYKTMMSIRS